MHSGWCTGDVAADGICFPGFHAESGKMMNGGRERSQFCREWRLLEVMGRSLSSSSVNFRSRVRRIGKLGAFGVDE
jgi:hypothetical protein